jgi:predicted nucleic acid-binding protein
MTAKTLVDTSVWSAAFRRKGQNEPDAAAVERLKDLILRGDAVMVGPVRQEILSGISDISVFESLREKLSTFPDLPIQTEDFITAADFGNQCRRKGVRGSPVDFLLCAVACRNNLMIFSTDNDFMSYAEILPIKLLRK